MKRLARFATAAAVLVSAALFAHSGAATADESDEYDVACAAIGDPVYFGVCIPEYLFYPSTWIRWINETTSTLPQS